jgi:hypothetical protein
MTFASCNRLVLVLILVLVLLLVLVYLKEDISNCDIVLSIYYKICVCVLISIVLVLRATFTSLAKATSLSVLTYSGNA